MRYAIADDLHHSPRNAFLADGSGVAVALNVVDTKLCDPVKGYFFFTTVVFFLFFFFVVVVAKERGNSVVSRNKKKK